jgi:hypothetical protein
VISFRARRRQVVRQERCDQIRHEIREQIELLERCEAGDPEAIRQSEENLRTLTLACQEPSEADYPEVVDLWRVPRAKPRARWRLSDDPTNGCRCLSCVEARANPMEERTPRHVARPLPGPRRWQLLHRRVLLSDAEREQLRIHEAHLARDLAMWHALVWAPEERQARLRALSLALRRVRAGLRADRLCRMVRQLDRLCHGPPLAGCSGHWIVPPPTGPPAGTLRIASRPEALLTCS